jgi:hypothetical protein
MKNWKEAATNTSQSVLSSPYKNLKFEQSRFFFKVQENQLIRVVPS